MQYVWILVFLPLVLGIFILFSSSIFNQANALSCEGPITVQKSFEDSGVVFFGEVISKKYFLVDKEYGFEDSIVKFKLIESFKGFSNKTMTVETSEWFFDPTYEVGNDYVVFAFGQPGKPLSHQLCTIQSLVSEEEILDELRLLKESTTCPKAVYMDEKHEKYSINAIQCVEKKIKNCDLPKTTFRYIAGPLNLSLEKSSGHCFIDILQQDWGDYGSRPYQYECFFTEINEWKSWQNSTGGTFYNGLADCDEAILEELTPQTIKNMIENLSPEFKTPKQQTNVGILPSEVQCKEGLELIFKSTDGSPACVKPKTAEKLIERGWANDVQNHISVSELFPEIPDADWTVTDKDVAEIENAFTDRYGILEGESWRYYNQNDDLQIFVGVMKIDNSKNPKDYFDFQQGIISKTENVGSMLIFDENALNSIDSEKCSGQKQAYDDGSIIFYILCQKEDFVFQITTSTYKDDLVEEYGIDFANSVSIKIR